MDQELTPPQSIALTDIHPYFSAVLKARLKEIGETQEGFAIQTAYSLRYIQSIANGHAPCPLERVEAWASILTLAGKSRYDFIEAAYLSNCPKWVVEKYLLMRGALSESALRALGVIKT